MTHPAYEPNARIVTVESFGPRYAVTVYDPADPMHSIHPVPYPARDFATASEAEAFADECVAALQATGHVVYRDGIGTRPPRDTYDFGAYRRTQK